MRTQTFLVGLVLLLALLAGCTSSQAPSADSKPSLLTTSSVDNSQENKAEDEVLSDYSQNENPAALSEADISQPQAGASPVKSDQVFMPGMEVTP